MQILDKKLEKLKNIISGYNRMLVALSGGVDSIFLLIFAYSLWKDGRIAALTANGPHFADDEIEYAASVCRNLGIDHRIISAGHILELIEDNPPNRCYICKKAIFSDLKNYAEMTGSILADGTNTDDMNDYRPGYRALQELGIASPLKDAGLTKADIRQALKSIAESDPFIKAALITDIWNKPAFACLASRIPYGQPITTEKLSAIYSAETFLKEMGFTQVRVRHHGDLARIEVPPHDRSKFYSESFMDKVNEGVRKSGFRYVSLDLSGYKMGNLNQEEQMTENKKFDYNDTKRKYDFDDLTEIISQLRSPGGCPWDIKQTHESLKECLTEESQEVMDAIDSRDDDNLCEELGDLLLQVLMHAQIAAEENRFDINDVIQCISEKMIRRHPHVFGDVQVSSPEESLALWKKIKEQEKAKI